MQIKSTKEVRDYKEIVYFGMNGRQFVFAVLAVLAGVGSYFLLRNVLSGEALSWVCMLFASPFAAFGFIKWHGMQMEQLIPMWYRSWFCLNKTLYFRPDNHAKLVINEYLKDIKTKEDGDAQIRKKRKSKTP